MRTDLKYSCKEINLNDNIGTLVRMIYAEASPNAKNFKCKIAVGEVIKNRLHSKIYKRRNYKNYKDVVEDRTWSEKHNKYFYQFVAIDKPKYAKTVENIKKPLEKNDFLISMQAGLIVNFTSSKISNGSLSFHRSSKPPDNKYHKYKQHEIGCKNNFFYIIN